MKKMNLNNKRAFLLIVLLSLGLFLVFLYLVFRTLTSTSIFINSPSPNEHEEGEPEKILEIVDLKDKTPHYGKFFSFTYDPNEGIFYVYIDPVHVSQGNSEFDEFLRQNGIPDKSYFPGLVTTNEPIQ